MNDFIDDAIKAHSEPKNPYHCGGVSHVHVSPPCQGFSRMNTTGSEANKEKNNKLSLTFPRLVIGIQATTGSFENVTGMLDDERVHYVQTIVYEFIMNDYQVRFGSKFCNLDQLSAAQARSSYLLFLYSSRQFRVR